MVKCLSDVLHRVSCMCLLHVPACVHVRDARARPCMCRLHVRNAHVLHLAPPNVLAVASSSSAFFVIPMVSSAAETHTQTLQPFSVVVCQDQAKNGSHRHQLTTTTVEAEEDPHLIGRGAGAARCEANEAPARAFREVTQAVSGSLKCQEGDVWRGIQAANKD